jgi:ubiquinone/menaquinone biosynthesis C-methylase UbiE
LFARETIKEIDIKPTDKILDIGCGDGRITLDLAKMVPQGQIIGTDLSDDMVVFAKKIHLSPERLW